MPVMNNARLNKYSESYMADTNEKVEQRCFFLFAGSDLNNGCAFSLDLQFANPDDPKQRKNCSVAIKVDDLTVEQCSDVLVSLTKLIPDFKTPLRFDDLKIKPGKLDLEKKIRHYAPLYYLRSQIVKSGPYTEKAVKNYMIHLFDQKR